MRPNRSPRRGFALPAVLAVTGVVTLVFLVAMTALASLNAEAGSARDRVRFLQRALTAEAMLTYVAATEPLSASGITINGLRAANEYETPTSQDSAAGPRGPETLIRLDGRTYRLDAPADLAVTLQDQGGMINLMGLNADQWRRLGQTIGLSPSQATRLGPLAQDYIDRDNMVGPGGSEASAYGSQPPPNRSLLRGSELLSVLGVRDDVQSSQWRRLRPALASDPTLVFMNVNTASAEALSVLLGLSPEQAQAAIRAREDLPFNTISDLAAASGASLFDDGEVIMTFPTGRVIHAIRDTRSAWTYRARMTLTPTSLEQPVWIDQTELTEAPRRAVADISDATRFPYAPR
jgi:type II secretory pathway component PulK